MAMAQSHRVVHSPTQTVAAGSIFISKPRRAAVLARSVTADSKRVQLPAADSKQTEDLELDAYYVATARLQQLLTDAALSNKDVVPIDYIDACSVGERLTLFANISSLTIMSAFAICLIFGELDPLGGMWLDAYTLDAMGQGVLYALPLLACSIASRSALSRPFPVLREMHELQHDLLRHFTAGFAAACCFNVRPKQIEVVRDALRNADAYFRLTQAQAAGAAAARPSPKAQRSTRPLLPPAAGAAMPTMFATSTLADGLTSSYEEEEEEEQQEVATTASSKAAADAFRMVSMVWFLSRRRVARLSYMLTSLNVAYLGVVWHATGNLGAPAAAAFLHAAAELWLGEWQARRQSVTSLIKATGDRQ